jgi:hypothetical protein
MTDTPVLRCILDMHGEIAAAAHLPVTERRRARPHIEIHRCRCASRLSSRSLFGTQPYFVWLVDDVARPRMQAVLRFLQPIKTVTPAAAKPAAAAIYEFT